MWAPRCGALEFLPVPSRRTAAQVAEAAMASTINFRPKLQNRSPERELNNLKINS